MAKLNDLDPAPERPSARLTRRSLVAAAGILAAVGPAAATKAFAHGPRWPWSPGPSGPPGQNPSRCFLAGTRVLTPSGEVQVEALKLGDRVTTESGAVRNVLWIGKTTLQRNGARHWPEDVRPVRISKGALGEGRPRRDLYLSRAHMLHLGGVLIPVGDLINGDNIAAVDVEGERLEYFHIVLEQHDVLLAEGTPCESLLVKSGGGVGFDNPEEYAEVVRRFSDTMVPYAPIASYNGGRGALKSRLRSALAPIVDLRRPADIVRDGVEARAEFSKAA